MADDSGKSWQFSSKIDELNVDEGCKSNEAGEAVR